MCFLALHRRKSWSRESEGCRTCEEKNHKDFKSSLGRTQKELYINPTFVEQIIGICLENLKLNEFYYLKEIQLKLATNTLRFFAAIQLPPAWLSKDWNFLEDIKWNEHKHLKEMQLELATNKFFLRLYCLWKTTEGFPSFWGWYPRWTLRNKSDQQQGSKPLQQYKIPTCN